MHIHGDNTIKWTDAVHCLGVTFNTHLDWNHQCKFVATKVTGSFNVLHCTFSVWLLQKKAKFIAFSSLILPIFEHAFSVWCGVRWACNSHYDPIHHQWTPSSASCCKPLHWQSLSFCCNVTSFMIDLVFLSIF